jgi:hypothetical protein
VIPGLVLAAINCPASAVPCPKVNAADITDATARLGLDHLGHIPVGQSINIQKAKGQEYTLRFTSATHMDVPGPRVVITQNTPNIIPGVYGCRYVVQSEDGYDNGDFELTIPPIN